MCHIEENSVQSKLGERHQQSIKKSSEYFFFDKTKNTKVLPCFLINSNYSHNISKQVLFKQNEVNSQRNYCANNVHPSSLAIHFLTDV